MTMIAARRRKCDWGLTVARRNTSKTGISKQGTRPRRSRTTQPESGAAASKDDKTTPPDNVEALATSAEDDVTDTPKAASEDTGLAPETPEIAPLADGPAQMGDDTLTASETPEQPGSAAEGTTPEVTVETEAAPDDVNAQAEKPSAPETGKPSAPETGDAPETTPDVTATKTVADAKPDTQPTAPVAPTPQANRGGFFPMLLGGLLAGGIGYGVHLYQTDQQPALGDDLDALRAELSELRATMAQGSDLSELESQIASLEPSVVPELTALEAAMDDLRAQITALPAPTDTSDLQAQIEALSAEAPVDLGPVQDSLAALESAYAPMPDQIAALQADMDDLRRLATEEVAEAEAAVDSAVASAGLDRIRAAFVTGEPFDDAIAQLRQAGIDVPTALQDAAGGVQTVEALQESYDPAARAALAASLQNAPADSATEKLGNFFRAQIGARSLAPREGDDPDAITARAGVAVAEGELAAARDELASLPEAGRAAMSDWLGAVETRLNAAPALDALQAEITAE